MNDQYEYVQAYLWTYGPICGNIFAQIYLCCGHIFVDIFVVIFVDIFSSERTFSGPFMPPNKPKNQQQQKNKTQNYPGGVKKFS